MLLNRTAPYLLVLANVGLALASVRCERPMTEAGGKGFYRGGKGKMMMTRLIREWVHRSSSSSSCVSFQVPINNSNQQPTQEGKRRYM